MEQTATKVSLFDAIKKSAEITFAFSLAGTEKTSDGQVIAILRLDTPLEYVRGSQKIPMADGTLKNLEATDVTEIKVLEADCKNEGFEMEADGVNGIFTSSDLVLDISKSNFEVWLRPETFATSGNRLRQANRDTRLNGLRGKLTAGQPNTIQ